MSRDRSNAADEMRTAALGTAVEAGGEQLVLCPERALVWPARRTLVVADAHFGKDDVFRRGGIPLPRGPAVDDLQRLARLVETHRIERLVVLGDFLHAATRSGDAFLHAFTLWRRAHGQLSIDVVAGNHDRREAKGKWEGLVAWRSAPLTEPPFRFVHEPTAGDGFALAGHLHPAVRLDRASGARVPVFWLRPDLLVLPAFGSFTGGAIIRAEPGDRVYAVGPERVVLLHRQLVPR